MPNGHDYIIGIDGAPYHQHCVAHLARRVAIHILEFFDPIGHTRRVWDNNLMRGGDRAMEFA